MHGWDAADGVEVIVDDRFPRHGEQGTVFLDAVRFLRIADALLGILLAFRNHFQVGRFAEPNAVDGLEVLNAWSLASPLRPRVDCFVISSQQRLVGGIQQQVGEATGGVIGLGSLDIPLAD